MDARVGRHIRGNVVGYIALFFALSLGTAWAVEKNSVKSKHIAKNGVKSKDIATGGVRSSDIATGGVTETNLADGAVTGRKLAANSVDGDKVAPDSLTGEDVVESSLDLPELPATLQLSGPAGGDLSGSYPNPTLRGGVVGAAELANNGVGSNAIANGAVDSPDLAANLDDTLGADDIATDGIGPDEVDNDALQVEDITVGRLREQGVAIFTPPGVDANTCTVINPSVAGITPGDLVLVIPRSITDGWTMQGGVATSANVAPVQLCNLTEEDAATATATYDVLAIGG